MNADGKMRLAALVHAPGSIPASWLHPDTKPNASTDIDSYISMVQTAERGKLDLFFIADTPAAWTDKLHAWSRFPMFMNVFEPVTLLSTLATTEPHRPRRHGLDQLHRALQRRAPVRLARSPEPWACGLERRHVRERLCRPQFRSR